VSAAFTSSGLFDLVVSLQWRCVVRLACLCVFVFLLKARVVLASLAADGHAVAEAALAPVVVLGSADNK
jgi:hypothetical protein